MTLVKLTYQIIRQNKDDVRLCNDIADEQQT